MHFDTGSDPAICLAVLTQWVQGPVTLGEYVPLVVVHSLAVILGLPTLVALLSLVVMACWAYAVHMSRFPFACVRRRLRGLKRHPSTPPPIPERGGVESIV